MFKMYIEVVKVFFYKIIQIWRDKNINLVTLYNKYFYLYTNFYLCKKRKLEGVLIIYKVPPKKKVVLNNYRIYQGQEWEN